MRGWGLDAADMEPSPIPFVVSIVGTFLGAYTLSWLIGRLGIEGGTVLSGAVMGGILGAWRPGRSPKGAR